MTTNFNIINEKNEKKIAKTDKPKLLESDAQTQELHTVSCSRECIVRNGIASIPNSSLRFGKFTKSRQSYHFVQNVLEFYEETNQISRRQQWSVIFKIYK